MVSRKFPPKHLIFSILIVAVFSCKERKNIDKNLTGKWELIHIFHSDSDGDLLKNDTSELIMIVDYIIIDKYGGFIMRLLTKDEQIKGRFVAEDKNKNYLILENATNKIFNGVYKYKIITSNEVTYLNLESDNVIINARRNPIIIKF
jgi:hypothetical protein